MKMLYFMDTPDGDFDSEHATTPDAICYPLHQFKGITSVDNEYFYMYFESNRASGTDAENDTSGVDRVTLQIKTLMNHKKSYKDITEVINKHLAQNNGFMVMVDRAAVPSVLPGNDFADFCVIVADEPE